MHRSALLGQRKSRATNLEKPQAFVRKERQPKATPEEPKSTPLAVVPEPPPKPVRKPKAPATPKAAAAKKPAKPKAPDGAAFQALVEEVARLSEALATRPTWSDLQALEGRLQVGDSESQEVASLKELLRTREEELEELGLVVSEFQEQNEQVSAEVQQLNRRLREAQQQAVEAEMRAQLAEGFLREALLGLLSPGDEFNEDLVEQIQHFLQP